MIEFLKKVGAGKERWEDLTYKEAYEANKEILNEKASDIQIGAFWSAMRIKYATAEELKGFIDALREETNYIDSDELNPVDLAIGYDGKNKSIHILPAAIFIATGAGAKVVGHGNERVPSKFGTTYQEVLNAMGCIVETKPDKCLKALELSGFAFYHQKYLNPKLSALLPKRQEFGLRNYLNSIEKLLNPFKTTKVLVGVTHKQFISKYIQLGTHVGFENIFLIKGLEGGIEPHPHKETQIYTNKIFSLSIYPKENKDDFKFTKIISLEENANICISILKNQENPFREWAILTAALIIISYEIEYDIKKSISKAEESLKFGAAYESFEIYKSLTTNKKIIF
ncbi:anthranilate phosphoribosyltransferase [Sulfurihydrogenibium sp.]|uniref:anthranilate phosphoribosyltransferase n=1 Tax=Sulfurihydrogenibium sp. TaxID=2053621 RepID=UPI00263047AC|nr:anthranilate phosphoribosyltransferase [Sulfurihydrogenibium sp.]